MSNNTLILLCGNVGSGKSTYYFNNFKGKAVRINQDYLGDRTICLKLLEACMQSGIDAVVDRTNINRQQRSYWIDLAKKYNYEVVCFYMDTPIEVCKARVLERVGHPTITQSMSSDKKIQIVEDFAKSLEVPLENEGIIEVISVKYNEN